MPISEEGTYYQYSLLYTEILGDTMGIKISCLLENLVLSAKILKTAFSNFPSPNSLFTIHNSGQKKCNSSQSLLLTQYSDLGMPGLCRLCSPLLPNPGLFCHVSLLVIVIVHIQTVAQTQCSLSTQRGV